MSFPYMSPHSLTFAPINVSVNIGMLPIFTPAQKITVTGATFTGAAAVNVADALSDIYINFVQAANATNVIASVLINGTCNVVANTPLQLNINATNKVVSAGTVICLNVSVLNSANKHLGTVGSYQIDYVQGSPGSEG